MVALFSKEPFAVAFGNKKYRAKDLLAAWAVLDLRIQVPSLLGCGIWRKFFTDNFDRLAAIENMVGAVLELSSSWVSSASSSSSQKPLFSVIFNFELKNEIPLEPAQVWSHPILAPIWVPILAPILVTILGPILVPILGALWLQIKFFFCGF